jgi:predicted lactoylglutathione lyase
MVNVQTHTTQFETRGNDKMSEKQSIHNNNPEVYGYCDLRFPVTDLKKSLVFYCDVLGFEMNNPNDSLENKEVLIKLKRGSAPPIFLMEVEKEHFKPMHFMHNGRIWEAIEFMSQDICALRDRLKQAGAQVVREPEFNDFGTLTFYDPDGHYIKAVEERGIYFKLKKNIVDAIDRSLSDQEDSLLKELCETTGIEPQKFISSMITLLKKR